MRILAISDLHTDFKKNRSVLEGISDTLYQNDCLIVAGDIAHQLSIIKETLTLLRSKFKQLFFVPGNHDLWVVKQSYNSIEKLITILKLCDSLDVHVRPTKINDIWVVPLFSWYHADFAGKQVIDTTQLEGWVDFHLCKWPDGLGRLDHYFARMNQVHLKTYDAPVISFSHFLPRMELLPPINRLWFKALPNVAGSLMLEQQIRQLRSVAHVFGHSHINWDMTLDGTRYVQNALSRSRGTPVSFPIKVIWDFDQQ